MLSSVPMSILYSIDPKGFPPDSMVRGWQIEGVPGSGREIIIPKGCIEIIFNFSVDKITYCRDGNKRTLPRCFISGINTAPVILDHSSNRAFLGLRLHPHAIKCLLLVRSGEFNDKTIDLTLIDPVFNELWHQLYPVDFGQRIALIKNWICRAYRPPHDLDIAIGRFLEAPNHDWSVARLSEQFCSSQRNLTRKFNQLLGMSTEEAVLYKKYLHALASVHLTNRPLTEIAYQSNFYDQSHFIREFKRYTGLTPKNYRKCKSPLCGHINAQITPNPQ